MDDKCALPKEDNSLTKYKVIIENKTDEEELRTHYGLNKSEFEAGEKVEFSLVNMTDTSTYVASDQASITREDNVDNGRIHYSFIMPAMDVEVSVTRKSRMMNPMMGGNLSSGFGMPFRPVSMSDINDK